MPEIATADTLRKLVGKLDATCIQHFQGATNVCASRSHYEITPEHLLLRMTDETTGDVRRIFNTFKIDAAHIRRALQRLLEEFPAGQHGKPVISPKLVELLSSASVLAEEMGFEQVRSGLLLLAIALNPSHTRLGEVTPEMERIDADLLRDNFREIVDGAPQAGAASPDAAPPGERAREGGPLEQFTIDLTAKATAGQIDPVFGRDHEVRQMIDILSRRRKNNPILVGEPGTGKTAIVEGLSLRIAKGDVPPILSGVKLISLDLGLLQAGAGVRGEFENRLKNVIRAIKESTQPIITFIDEAHTLIGAGGQAGGGDAANLLKPALARGELRTIAATTWAEYKKYFEKDAALERRFQLVRCEEPSPENAIVMLRGLKEKYELHHKIIILDEAVQAAVRLSSRYISGRFLPDKAVDLLDTSAARVAVSLTTRPGVLDDIDRSIGHLETAIAAIDRDHAGGLAADEAVLSEMRTARESLIAERAKVEEKWQRELEAVRKIHDLRSRLRAYAAPAPSGNGDGQPAAKEPTDEGPIRAEIDAAVTAMRTLQGEAPLVHAHVDAAAVAAVVADWTGIPIGKMVKDEVSAALQMENRLTSRVVGQDHALGLIAKKLRTAKSGLGNPQQPMGVFLLVGPSGVGKTELAMAVADLLFGGDRFMVTINMSEFMEKHTVSQLKGSPPGYVGYGEGGVLTEAVRQHPYSVVLLDEVEKAHPDVLNLFYQVFDKGTLADGEGRVIDFKNTVIFMTSNLGTDVIQGMCESGETVDVEALREGIYPQLREHFKPALLARMTVIPFLTIGAEIMKSIARMKVGKVGKRLADAHKMTFEVDDAAYESIAARCTQVDVGARNIDHILDQIILPEMSRRLLEHMGEEHLPRKLRLGVNETGEFTFEFGGE